MSREFRAYFLSILFLLVAAFAWLTFLPANAAMLCGPRKQVIDNLKSSAQEREIWFGHPLGAPDAVMLLLASDKGTWTLLVVRPDVSCIIAGGTGSALGVPA